MSNVLYIVATPIGNLSDMTFRAVDVLQSVDLIAAEDTRHSKRLLTHYQITTPCLSLHDHNESQRIHKIIACLSDGKSVALISDAGTPLISDPGFRLVRAIKAENFKVVPVPGACAAIAALIASGLPTDRFLFEGFLPIKKSALQARLSELKNETCTVIFYESTHRIVNTLQIMCEVMGDQRVATVARELTKTFETIKQGALVQLCDWIKDPNQQKGEFVIVLKGVSVDKNQSSDEMIQLTTLLQALLSELPLKQAVQLACKISGKRRKMVYARALELKSE